MDDLLWLVQDRVILFKSPDVLTRQDVLLLNEALTAMLDQSTSETIYVIFDARDLQQFPKSIPWLYQNYTAIKHPKYAMTINITTNALLRYIGTLLPKLMGSNMPRFVSTFQEAAAILNDIDPTLPPMPDSIGE